MIKSAAGVRLGTSPTPAVPSWPGIPLDGDRLRDSAIRALGGLLAITHQKEKP